MSIENLLKDLIEAVQENTDTLKSMTGKTAAAASKTTGTADKGEDKAPAKTAPKATGGKTPTVAAMKKAATDFLELAGEDEDDYLARREFVVELATEFDAERFSDIAAKNRTDALERLADYANEEEKPKSRRDRDDIA